MAARPVGYLDPALLEEIIGAHHVVDIFDLMVDVLDPAMRRLKQHHRMMHRRDAQKRRRADPVGDARVADARPEALVAFRVGTEEADMAETGDAGVAAREIAHAAMERPRHELDLVAGRIGRGDKAAHATLLALLLGPEARR